MRLSIVKNVFYENGFRRKGNVLYRVTNDVLQNVEMNPPNMKNEIRAVFGITPLCIGITRVCQGCLYDLSYFSQPDGESGKQTRDDCIKSVYDCCQRYLLPLFASADSCAAAFPSLWEVLSNFNEMRRWALWSAGIPDKAPPFETQCLLNEGFTFMALKNEDYNFAERSLREILNKECQKYQVNAAHHLSESTLQRHMEAILNWQRLLHNVESRDTSAIRELLEENERQSIQYIMK